MKKPTKKSIAAALGISPPAFTRYVRRGCPTYSIEAARAWQQQHIDPTQRQLAARPTVFDFIDKNDRVALAVVRVRALFALAGSDFDRYAEQLRAALRAVPPPARRRVQLDLDLMRRLLPPKTFEVLPPDSEGTAAESAEGLEEAGAVLYRLACGEAQVVDPVVAADAPDEHAE